MDNKSVIGAWGVDASQEPGRRQWSGWVRRVSTAAAAVGLVSLAANASALEVPGSSQGNLSVSAGGSAQYSLPLVIPPGVGGAVPRIALQYSSHGDNGLLGVGWSLAGLYTINRCPQTQVQDGAQMNLSAGANDRFCLNGKRLILVSGTYGANGAEYRTELDEISRITSTTSLAARGPDSFKIWTRDGLVIELGVTADSKLVATTTSSAAGQDANSPFGFKNTVALAANQPVLQWNVSRVSDRKSNYYTVTYTKTDLTGEIYPATISYSGNNAAGQTALAPTNTITFTYEARPTLEDNVTGADYPLQYLAGSKVQPGKRLKEVAIAADAVLARKYMLAYQTPKKWGAMRSVLKTVTECTYTSGGFEYCFAPTQFDTSEYSACIYDSYRSQLASAATSTGSGYTHLAQDFDGDGRTDLVAFKIDSTGIRVLDSHNGTTVPSGTDFVPPTDCRTSVKPGVSFGSPTVSQVNSTNYGASTNWSVTSADLNGDGLPEIVAIPLSGALNPVVTVRQPSGSYALGTASAVDSSNYSSTTHQALGGDRAWLVDVDGDNLQDVVALKYVSTTTNVALFFRKGLGNGTFAQTVRQDVTIGLNDSPLGFNTFVGDVDGDGRADLTFVRLRSGVITADVLRGNGVGITVFQAMQSTNLINQTKFDDALGTGTVTRIQLLDVNRDGLADLVFAKVLKGTGTTDPNRNKSLILTALSKGNGTFVPPNVVTSSYSPDQLVSTTSDLSALPWRTSFTDINGDGRVDMFLTQVLTEGTLNKNRLLIFVFLNRGDGRFVYGGGTWSTNENAPSLAAEANWTRLSGDFDGDGLGDLVSVQANGSYGYEAYPIFSAGPLPDLLTQVTDGNGAVTRLVQVPLTRDEVYTKGTATYPKIAVRPALYVVKTLTRDSGNELAGPTWSYRYAGAVVDVGGRGYLGFASGTVIDPLGIETTTTYAQTFPYIGMTVSASTNKGGVVLSSVDNTFEHKVLTHASGKASYLPYVRTSLAKQYEYTSTMLTSQTSTTYDVDTWGNPLSVASTITGDGNTYTQTTTHTYFANTINATTWRIGELQRKTEQRTGPVPAGEVNSITRTVAYTYDGAGLMATHTVEPDEIMYRVQTTINSRDRFGNVLSASVSGDGVVTRTESSTYDASGRFALTKTNAEGHVTTVITMDNRFGLPKNIKAPNNTQRAIQRDEFGRVTKEQLWESWSTGTLSAGPFTTEVHMACDSSCLTAQGESYSVKRERGGSLQAVATVISYYDRNGRERRKVEKGMDGRDIITATEYDAMGRVARVSRPYYADSATIQWTERQYDAIGRLWKEIQPGGRTTTYGYEGRTTIATNSKLQVEKKTVDALGRLVASIDAANQTQTFAYDPFGNTVRAQDAKGNLVINGFDLLGRKFMQYEPDMGRWTYQYDVFGQLVSQTDQKDQTTHFVYDKLGRVLVRSEPNLLSTWTWDTATNGKGRLAKLTGDNGFERSYSYDGYGQVLTISTKKSIDPNAQAGDSDFVHKIDYDIAGRPSVVTYPTGFGYKNLYNSYGYLTEVRNKDTNELYWRAVKRDAEGNVTRETLGNGLTTDRSYAAETGYLETIQTGTLSGSTLTASVQNDAYGFDTIGNLISRSQYFGSVSLSETFGYDSLNRLTSVQPLNGSEQTVRYDEIGNVTYRSDVGDYSYAGCGGAHRVCGVGFGSAMTYDGNGNLLSGNGRTLTWASYNYPLQITEGGNTESFLYSPERERVVRTSVDNGQTTTTVYLNPRIDLGNTFEKTYKPDGSVTFTHYLYAGGRVIGSVKTLPPTATSGYWATGLSTAPTAGTNPTGITMAGDPYGLVTWDNSTGNGRLVFSRKTTPTSTTFAEIKGQRSYLDETVTFRGEITPTTAGNGSASRYIKFGVCNSATEGSSLYQAHAIILNAGTQASYVVSGSNTTTVLQHTALAGVTYVVEVVTTASSSTLYIYEKGKSRNEAASHTRSIDWKGGSNNFTRSLCARVYGATGTIAASPVYLDELSEYQPATSVTYFHSDHLGSLTAVTDAAGQVVERLSYDVWGKRRQPDGGADSCSVIRSQITPRGYTLHEHLDGVRLVHMNGRVYDPKIGRFVSADPNVFHPGNMQNFNRYSYVHNNPLSYTDPSGFDLVELTGGDWYTGSVGMYPDQFKYMMANSSYGSTTNYVSMMSGSSVQVTVTSSSSSTRTTTSQYGGTSVSVGNSSTSSSLTSSTNRAAASNAEATTTTYGQGDYAFSSTNAMAEEYYSSLGYEYSYVGEGLNSQSNADTYSDRSYTFGQDQSRQIIEFFFPGATEGVGEFSLDDRKMATSMYFDAWDINFDLLDVKAILGNPLSKGSPLGAAGKGVRSETSMSEAIFKLRLMIDPAESPQELLERMKPGAGTRSAIRILYGDDVRMMQ